jgi:hypothetical protein
MVSNFPRAMASRRELTSTVVETHHADEGLGERVFGRVRQMVCGMHGHDSLLQFEQDRMFLRCASCGHESPGWVLDETPPTALTAALEDDSRVASQSELINERRIA